MQRAFDLAAVGRVAAFRLGVPGAAQLDDLACVVLDELVAGQQARPAQAYLAARGQAPPLLHRLALEVGPLHVDLARQEYLSPALTRIVRHVGCVETLDLPRFEVGDDDLER